MFGISAVVGASALIVLREDSSPIQLWLSIVRTDSVALRYIITHHNVGSIGIRCRRCSAGNVRYVLALQESDNLIDDRHTVARLAYLPGMLYKFVRKPLTHCMYADSAIAVGTSFSHLFRGLGALLEYVC